MAITLYVFPIAKHNSLTFSLSLWLVYENVNFVNLPYRKPADEHINCLLITSLETSPLISTLMFFLTPSLRVHTIENMKLKKLHGS